MEFNMHADGEEDNAQAKEKLRQVRREYRDLISQTEEHRKELMDPTNNGLLDNVERANRLYKNVSGTNEATLDARLLVLSADLGMQKAKQLRMGQAGFDEVEYLGRIMKRLGGHGVDRQQQRQHKGKLDLNWFGVGEMASKWTRRAPAMDFMLGPMSVDHKSRVMAQRTKVIRDPKQMRKPQEMQESDIVRQENETTKNVMEIYRLLEGLDSKVNLFELVINPDSFGQSVENLFYLSFLVRDGKVSISEENPQGVSRDTIDPVSQSQIMNSHASQVTGGFSGNSPSSAAAASASSLSRSGTGGGGISAASLAKADSVNWQPMVELADQPSEQDYADGLLKKQIVMELDMATWRDIIEAYDIKQSMIPTRVSKEKMQKGKWYG